MHPAAFFALLIAAALALALSVGSVNHWQGYRPYQWLAAIGALGLPLLTLLHNAFYALAEHARHPLLTNVYAGLSVASFVGAVVICPIALLGALAGAALLRVRHS